MPNTPEIGDLLLKHRSYLRAVLYKMCPTLNEFEAEDMIYATFERILKSSTFSVESGSKAKNYLCSTIRSVYIDSYRKNKNFTTVSLSSDEDRDFDIEDVAQHSTIDKDTIIKCLSETLKPMEMSILILHIDGHNYKQISDILKIPSGTARSNIHKIRKKSKRILSTFLGEHPTIITRTRLNKRGKEV